MTIPYSDEYSNHYEDHRSNRVPPGDRDRRRTYVSTIRLLTSGLDPIIEHNRRYDENQQEGTFPGHFPSGDEQNVSSSSFIGVFPFLRNIFCLGFFVIFLVLLSFGEYSLFYNFIMPPLHSNNILYFDYSTAGIANHIYEQIPPEHPPRAARVTHKSRENTTNNTIYNEDREHNDATCNRGTSSGQESAHFFPNDLSLYLLQSKEDHRKYQSQKFLQSAPVAVVDLFSNHNSWLHFHPDVIPQPKHKKHVLKAGAPHYIEIVLDLPESNTNTKHIGIFSIVVDLYSTTPEIANDRSNGTDNGTAPRTPKLLASSTRSARMPHESYWISIVRKVICIVPHMLGAIPESRRVIVPSFRFFIESDGFPLRYLTVRLLVSPEKAHRGDLVEVVQGMLQIGEELTGLQLVLKEWFFTSLMIGTLIFFSLNLVFALVLHTFWNAWCLVLDEIEQERDILEDVSGTLDLDGFDGAENSMRHADNDHTGPSSRDRSFSDHTSERRSSQHQQQSNPSVEILNDEEAEWEDLPQPMERESRTSQNEEDGNNEERSTDHSEFNSANNERARPDDDSHHLIPDT